MSSESLPMRHRTTAPLIFGHRGAAGLLPENTLPSFARAVELDVDGIELDVHCGHGRLWVIHDTTLTRTTGLSGTLEDYPPERLRTLDAGGGAGIPSLTEVLAALPPSIMVNIELKGPHTAAPVFELTRSMPQHRFLISSFDHEQLVHYRALGGNAAVGVLLDRWHDDALDRAHSLNAWSLNLALRITNADRVQRAHAQGFKVLVYTVNQVRTAKRLKRMGVDGLFTDRPDRVSRGALAD